MGPDPGRLLLVVNPASGRRRAHAAAGLVAAEAREDGFEVEVRETGARGDAREIARAADRAGLSAVGAVGGDGTLHEVIDGLRLAGGAPLPLLVVPAGAGNSLARELGLGSPAEAARRLRAGRTRSIDLGRAHLDGTEVLFHNVLAWGLAAAVTERGERMRRLGTHRYTVAALLEICRRGLEGPACQLDGVAPRTTPLLGAVCNTVRAASGMQLAPAASIDDGLLDLVLLEPAPLPILLSLLVRVFGGWHTGSPRVAIRPLERLTVEFPAPTTVLLDGELASATAIEVECAPCAWPVFA